MLRGKKLKAFLESAKNFGKDMYVPTKTTVLGVFDFRVFLNMAMLLSESEKAQDTFYSEILYTIAAYESGLADAIKREYEQKGHILLQQEMENLFRCFEKMASCDMVLREAFYYQLSEDIQPLDRDEYQKSLV